MKKDEEINEDLGNIETDNKCTFTKQYGVVCNRKRGGDITYLWSFISYYYVK